MPRRTDGFRDRRPERVVRDVVPVLAARRPGRESERRAPLWWTATVTPDDEDVDQAEGAVRAFGVVLARTCPDAAVGYGGSPPSGGENTDTRTTSRNGHREKTVTTQGSDLELAIPKLRAGSFFPSLLESKTTRRHQAIPRRRYRNPHE